MLPTPQALQKERLAAVVLRPDHDTLGGTSVHGDGGVEALGESEGQSQEPDASDHRSGAQGREPWLEGVDNGHVPMSRGLCELWASSHQSNPHPLLQDPVVPLPSTPHHCWGLAESYPGW